jgi:hypothetical protein
MKSRIALKMAQSLLLKDCLTRTKTCRNQTIFWRWTYRKMFFFFIINDSATRSRLENQLLSMKKWVTRAMIGKRFNKKVSYYSKGWKMGQQRIEVVQFKYCKMRQVKYSHWSKYWHMSPRGSERSVVQYWKMSLEESELLKEVKNCLAMKRCCFSILSLSSSTSACSSSLAFWKLFTWKVYPFNWYLFSLPKWVI